MEAKFLCAGNSYYEPIPLTEEWVFNLGFVQGKTPWGDGELKFDDYTLGPVTIYPVTGPPNMWQVAFHKHMLQIFIYNVHELQNLFFTFTNEELIRK